MLGIEGDLTVRYLRYEASAVYGYSKQDQHGRNIRINVFFVQHELNEYVHTGYITNCCREEPLVDAGIASVLVLLGVAVDRRGLVAQVRGQVAFNPQHGAHRFAVELPGGRSQVEVVPGHQNAVADGIAEELQQARDVRAVCRLFRKS